MVMTRSRSSRSGRAAVDWVRLTESQKSVLSRIEIDGFLLTVGKWEMGTIRCLRTKGLLKPVRPPTRSMGKAFRWVLTDKAIDLVYTAGMRAGGDR
jgi:hypothetical protein